MMLARSANDATRAIQSKLSEGGLYRGFYGGRLKGLLRGILGVWTMAHKNHECSHYTQTPPSTCSWGYMTPNSGYLGPNRGYEAKGSGLQ